MNRGATGLAKSYNRSATPAGIASVKRAPVPVDEVDLEADRNGVSVVVNLRSIRYGTLTG